MNMIRIFVPTFVLFCSPAIADVLDVNRTSGQFRQIGDAVAAAVDGDVIRVAGGNYDSFTIDNKRLVLITRPNSGVVAVSGKTAILNIGSGSAASIADFVFQGTTEQALLIDDCTGSVRLRDCLATGSRRYESARIQDSTDVAFFDCYFMGGPTIVGSGVNHGEQGADGIETIDSNISADSCTFEGIYGSYASHSIDPGGSGGDGVQASNSGTLYFAGCSLIGSGGGQGAPASVSGGCCNWGGSGGSGFKGFGVDAWFLDCQFQFGIGGPPGPCSQFNCGWPGSRGQDGVDANIGRFLPGSATSFHAPTLMQDNGSLQLTFAGLPGTMVGWISADRPDYSFRPFRGPYLVFPGTAHSIQMWHFAGRIGVSGTLTVQLNVGDSPAFAHRNPYFQGAYRDAQSGMIYYTGSTQTVILDSAW